MEVKKIGVIGAGTIGFQIAQLAAQLGYQVTLRDIDEGIIQAKAQEIKSGLKKFFVDKGKMTQEKADEIFASMKFTTDLKEAAADADLVVESIPEVMELKKQLFKELDAICPPHTILATNTSSLSITEIGCLTKRQDKVVGWHFANPVAMLKHVELIRGFNTSDETMEAMKELSKIFEREYVLMKDAPGHGARLLCVQLNEAIRMIADGICTPEDIDKTTKTALGHRWGLMEVADLSLDVPYNVLCYLQKEYGEKYAPHPLLKQMVLAGRLGKKSGKGFYDYTK
jgi:3-hydroxybutyryl-CoA dehydrogenase